MTTLNLLEANPEIVSHHQLEKLAPFIKSDLTSKSITSSLIKGQLTETDTDALIKDTLESVEIHGKYGYRLQGKDYQGNLRKDTGYLGMGLTHNPRHRDLSIDPLVDPHEQVQGNHWPNTTPGVLAYSRINNATDRKRAAILNSHYDTYSMGYRTEGSRYGYLGTFLDSIKRTLVRTSVRIINSGTNQGNVKIEQQGQQLAGVGWHTDEQIFVNLRINIPILTNENFVLEQQFRKGQLFHLEAPYAYSWDTGEPHRAYAKIVTPEPFYRTHIMLGIAPWWDFDEETHTWTKNEFHGRKHPLDMLVDGDVIPGFKLIEQI
jgi:hypothetical protein